MIVFSLACDNGHVFEAWFRNGADFEAQAAGGGIACPACGSARVGKALMTPAVPSATREGRRGGTAEERPAPERGGDAAPSAPPAQPAPAPHMMQLAAPDPRRQEIIEALRRIRQEVTANAVNVGDKFAEEARKIHYREVEPRGIYGQATLEEAKSLAEEGIDFHALPVLPEERN